MKAINYRQGLQLVERKLEQSKLFEKSLFATRQFAKRQCTWMRGWENLIYFDLHQASNVDLIIYDILGRAVRRLVRDIQQPGFKMIKWNGKDNTGRNVSAGVYFCRLQAGKFQETIKIAVVK